MKVIFEGTIPKDKKYSTANEDTYTYCYNKSLLALSDGASESYDSKKWALTITNSYIKYSDNFNKLIDSSIEEYEDQFDKSKMSWSMEAAYTKGSFATLLGLREVIGNKVVEIISIGDSIAVLLDGEKRIKSFPYLSSKQFAERPLLVSTVSDHNKGIFANIGTYLSKWDLQEYKKPKILFMTDALGEWAFRNEEEYISLWDCLSKITDISLFERIIEKARKNKMIRIDDTTLLILTFN